MFACITRKSGNSDKDLECHGFVCKSTEEAVSIAAQLYQSLVDTVKAQGNDKKVLRIQISFSRHGTHVYKTDFIIIIIISL